MIIVVEALWISVFIWSDGEVQRSVHNLCRNVHPSARALRIGKKLQCPDSSA